MTVRQILSGTGQQHTFTVPLLGIDELVLCGVSVRQRQEGTGQEPSGPGITALGVGLVMKKPKEVNEVFAVFQYCSSIAIACA